MLCNLLVTVSVVVVTYDENHVKTRQDRGLEVNVLARTLEVIVAAKDWVCRRKYRGTCIENGSDAGFGNRNSLLFHGLVDSNSVLVAHLVKLINANYTSIGQYHRATL